MKTSQSRRDLLVHAAKGGLALLVSASLGPTFLSACKKGQASEKGAGTAAKAVTEQVIPCPNQESLSDQEKTIRTSLKYVDASVISGRTCDNCKLYTRPLPGASCGGCKVVPGPIHPKGHCTAWLQLM